MTRSPRGKGGTSAAILNTVSLIPQHVVFQKVGDEVILLNLGTGIYYGLNPVGARIWELIAQRKDLKTVLRSMTEEYEAGAEQVRRDLLRLVCELKARGLIEVAKP